MFQKLRSVHSEEGRLNPLSNISRWRAATGFDNGKCPIDLRRDAMAAWRGYENCVQALPTDRAAPLLQAVLADVGTMAHG
jgi:hypothetical protein